MGNQHAFEPNFRELIECSGPYLEEYGRFQRHLALLTDTERVRLYLEAINRFEPGGVVVDVGAGSGLLGIAALRHGFEKAILIEPSRKMAAYASHMAEINGVSGRVTILTSQLELLPPEALPKQIDLIVSETISSLIFGFGSWDALPALVERTPGQNAVIPLRGELYAALATRNYASRRPDNFGLEYLKRAGIVLDLFERTFPSGGNVFEKKKVIAEIKEDALKPVQLAGFDFSREQPFRFPGASLPASSAGGTYLGILLYWDVQLAEGQPPIQLSSVDPGLESWRPIYVPFKRELQLGPGETARIDMALRRVDSPYTYAFQFCADAEPVTEVLYW